MPMAYLEWLKLEDGEAIVVGVARGGHLDGCWVSVGKWGLASQLIQCP